MQIKRALVKKISWVWFFIAFFSFPALSFSEKKTNGVNALIEEFGIHFGGKSSSAVKELKEKPSICPEYLIGKWQGQYFYNSASDRAIPTDFTLKINKITNNGLNFEGETLENRTNWGSEDLKELTASVSGQCYENQKITFSKTYNFVGGHTINYKGIISRSSSLKGQWSYNDDWTGSWRAEK